MSSTRPDARLDLTLERNVSNDRGAPLNLRKPGHALPDLLKPGSVADMLGVSRSWVYAAAADGRIPSLRLGGPEGPLRFVAADIEEWLAAARAAWRPGQSTTETLQRAQTNG